MIRLVVNFASLMLSSLVVGAMFGIWLAGNLVDLSSNAYLQKQQSDIRALNIVMPILGLASALLTLVAAFLARHDRRRASLLVAAFVALMAAGLVTRFLNQPINAIVMTWSPESPPADWAAFRDKWWQWHLVRTGLGVSGLSLLIFANLVREEEKSIAGPSPGA